MEAHHGALERLVKRETSKRKSKGPVGVTEQEDILGAVYAAYEQVEKAEKQEIQAVQRSLEELLTKLLVLGVGPPLRHNISQLLCQLYLKGDNIALYSCVGKLQDCLNGKEAKNVADPGKVSVLHCLSKLVERFGTQLGSGFQESLTIGQKLYKSSDGCVREGALVMLASYVSTCTRDRFASQAQEASLKLAERGSRDKVENVRIAAAGLLASIGFAGGQGLYTNGTAGFDEAVRICLRGIEDAYESVSTAFSEALGQIASCTASTSAAQSINTCKEAKKQYLKQLLDNPCETLIGAFLKSLSEGRGTSCVCIILALRRCFHDMKCLYHCSDEKLSGIVIQSLEMLNSLGKATHTRLAHAQACVVYFFHSGPLELLGNVSQIYLLGKLIRLMEKNKANGSVALQLGLLQCSRHLIHKLGSVEEEQAENLLEIFSIQLKSKSTILSQQAALTISALLYAYPKISESVTSKYLEDLSSRNKSAPGSEILGYGYGLAAALSVVSTLEIGIPERLIQRSLEYCSLVCVGGKSSEHSLSSVRAGYTILTSLLSIEDALDIPAKEFFKFFDLLKEEKATMHGRWKGSKLAPLMQEFQCHSSALETLQAFARQLLKDERANFEFLQYASKMLSQYLSLLVEAPITGKPSVELSNTLQQLQLSLIRAFTVIPPQASSSKCKHAFFKLSTVSFQVSDANVPRSSLLRHCLDDTDSSLGPWYHGYDDLEDELQDFKGSLYSSPLSFDKKDALQIVFHHGLSTEVGLLNASIELLQKLFCHFKWKEQKYFLELILHSMKSSLNVGRSEKKRLQRDTVFINSSCALLGLLHSLDKGGLKDKTQAVVNLLLPCAKILLEEGSYDAAFVRASAEIAAGACDLGGEEVAKSIVKSLCSEDLSKCTAENIKGLTLWLGAMGRSLGGISLTGLLDSMIKKLQQIVSSGIDETSQIWLLHSYWLIANAAGPAFIPYVKQMLKIATQVNILSKSHSKAILQTVARIGNSVVGVLGPEFSPGGFAFQRSSLLIAGTKCSNDDYGAQLEQVLHIQQLLLFAPHVSTISASLDTLKPFMRTGQPGVRLAAATTLRHLAETTPYVLAKEGIERDVISALDLESDPKIQKLLERVFCIIMEIGCEENPSKWIQFCQNIILNENTGDSGGGSDFLNDDEDGEGEAYGAEDAADAEEATGSCLETRVFVMECLCSVFSWVAEDDRHWDIVKANESHDGDWLILQLQNLINSGFKICTGNLPALQPKGIHLLNIAVEKFGGEVDPDYEGHQLMEQYQAQLLSALRSSFEQSALPTMTTVGLELAANLIEKNILGDDVATLKRVLNLMCKCLEYFKPGHESHYSEQIIDKLKIVTMESFSRLFCYCLKAGANSPADQDVNNVLISSLTEEHRAIISKGCLDLVSDYLAKAVMGKEGSRYSYNFRFISSSLLKKSQKFLTTVESMTWLPLIDAFLLSADPSLIKKNDVFICSSIEFAFNRIHTNMGKESKETSDRIPKLVEIASHFFQCHKKGNQMLSIDNCSRILRLLDRMLHEQIIKGGSIQERFLECVAFVYHSMPADYLLNNDLRTVVCKLACRCVIQFCQLNQGINGAKELAESEVSVSSCAKVWDALLSLASNALALGNVDAFQYCLKNMHYVFATTTSDTVLKAFGTLLIKALQKMDKSISSTDNQLSKSNMTSCGLSFAVSFIEKVKGKSFHTSYSESNVVSATTCLSITQYLSKIDFAHKSTSNTNGGGSKISGFELTRDLFQGFLDAKASPKLQCLLLQIWNKDISQHVAQPDKEWVCSLVTYFAPGVAQLTASATQSLCRGVDEDNMCLVAVEGLKFFGLCLQSFTSEEKKQAISSLAFPLFYLALTNSSGSKASKALSLAANKLFNLFASKSAASAKAYVQNLPLDERQLLTKGLQESTAAASARPAVASNTAGKGGRFNPGRIKKPTIALKSFGVK
jgi:hypothetical protein